jgi:predicted secreted protein
MSSIEKQKNMARWKSKNGFDVLNKRENWNEHPKSPPQSKKDEFLTPYHVQKAEEKAKLKSHTYDPREHNGLDFHSHVKSPTTFSEKEFFNSVFVSGGDAEKEAEDYRKNEQNLFSKKVVVDSLQFKVNTIVKKHDLVDKYKLILEDPPKKNGLSLSKKQLRNMTLR